MKFFHLSDLHIGKQLNGYSLQDNQRAVLEQVAEYARVEKPDAILLCGDIYDKSIPSAEAGTLFDSFLTDLWQLEIPVLIISGNHDSGERLSYAGGFLENHRIYVGARLPEDGQERLKKVTLEDEYGAVNFYLLPFLKPGYVRRLFPEGRVTDYQSAVEAMLEREEINWEERNVILSHQFYVWNGQRPQTCDSESAVLASGGLDAVDARVLEPFDYAALGHIHGRQKVGRPHIRYSGSPYKYSVSEERHQKAVTVAELGRKGGEVSLRFLPLKGLQDVRRIRGSLEEIRQAAGENCHDFVSVTLTDSQEPYDLKEQVEALYDSLLELRVDNERTRARLEGEQEDIPALEPLEAFGQFFRAVCKRELEAPEREMLEAVLSELREETEGEEEKE